MGVTVAQRTTAGRAHETPPATASGGGEETTLSPLFGMPGHLIRRSQQIAVALFVEELGPLDLTPVQFAVLMAIDSQPGIEAARVSQLIAFDRSTLGDVLDRLSNKQLIERRPSEIDKRVKRLWLTASGKTLFDRATPAVARVQQRILAPLPTGDREHYIDMLRRLVGLHTGEARYRDVT